MKKLWYPIVYMFVVTFFFSAILIGLSRITRDRVRANEQSAFEKAIILSLPLDLPENISATAAHRMFVERVTLPDESSVGAYRLMEGDTIIAYALPISGQGFWAPIKGIIGIAADMKTITGIAFYEQKETPGLGAEIIRLPFRKQFVGKTISTVKGPLAIKPVSAELGKNEVHAITGATQTSTRLEKIINNNVIRWRTSIGGLTE